MKEAAIHNAILDFSEKCSLFHKDSVFSVSFKDSLYSLVLKQTDERNFHLVKDRFYEGVVTVSIVAYPNYQFYFSEETKSLKKRLANFNKQLNHRPILQVSEEHTEFLKKLEFERNALLAQYPFLNDRL